MTNIRVVWGYLTTTANILFFHLEISAVIAYLAWASF